MSERRLDWVMDLPGMRRGRRVRNVVVGVVYLVSLPIVTVLLLLFTVYVLVGMRLGRSSLGDSKGLQGSGTALDPMITRMAMLGLTAVIAAGVAGVFVTGFATLPGADVPQASFSFEQTGPHTVEITHEAGDQLDAGRIVVRIGGRAAAGSWSSTPIDAGSQYRVTGLNRSETIRVVYADSGSKSTVLATYDSEGG